MSLLIHGSAKIGKSTLAATSPTPTLLLDAEGGWKFVRQSKAVREAHDGRLLRMIQWDPMTEDIPKMPEDPAERWDVAVVSVEKWETVQRTLDWLHARPADHPFVSIAVDSITEIQRKCLKHISPDAAQAVKMQDWGVLLRVMDTTIRAFRDLVDSPTQPNLRVITFIAESKENAGGQLVPAMQGQIATQLPYRMDVLGYLWVSEETDSQGNPINGSYIRNLLLSGRDPKILAGSRVEEILGTYVTKPSIQTILNDVYPKE